MSIEKIQKNEIVPAAPFTAEDVERRLQQRQPAGQMFEPRDHYDSHSDRWEFLVSPESYYSEPIDRYVTAYYGQETGEVVGWVIKNTRELFRELLRKAPGFRTEIEHGRIRVEYLFTAKIWHCTENPDEARVIAYRKVREKAHQEDIEGQVGDELIASAT